MKSKYFTQGIPILTNAHFSTFRFSSAIKKWSTAILGILTVSNLICAQINYSVPQELILHKNSVIESGRSDLCLIYSNPPLKYNDYVLPTFSLSRIFPIGWSNDGKFAYFYKPSEYSNESNEWRGYYLTIVDLNTDSTIILSQYGDTDREAKLLSLKAIWNKNIIEIEKFLKRYKIIQSIKIELNSFPIIINDEPFKDEEKIYLNNYTLLVAHDGESQRVKYGLHSTLRGDKIIYNKWIEYSPQSYDFTIIGYFISPFQKKIAILQQYTKKGSCGTIPRDLEFNFIGAQLDSGYSR